MRILRPALPAFILLLSAVGLGVPASSAQSKGSAKKKPSASGANTAPAKPSAAKNSPKAASPKSASATKKNVSGSDAKSTARNGNSRSTGKRNGVRSRRQPGQKAPTSDRVSEIQAALAKDGSFAGTPNGKWDDDTARAMRKFQAAHGLNPTGKLDALSLQKLGLGSQTAGVAAPVPPPGAVSRLTSSAMVPAPSTETARRQ